MNTFPRLSPRARLIIEKTRPRTIKLGRIAIHIYAGKGHLGIGLGWVD